MLADVCNLAQVYEAVTSTCQGLKQISLPAFIFIEGTFYCVGGSSALVPEEHRGPNSKSVQSAERTLLNDLEYKIGYPYMVRHSTSDSD